MLVQVIDGFNERMQKATEAQDYEQLRLLDAACLRFMSNNLPPRAQDEAELRAVKDSLERLQLTYREAVKACLAAKNEAHQELHSVGRSRRNAIQYLDVARNIVS
ncbi:MAG TPA: hypothetical protein VM553_09130 [Dongiaceae bacterium]|nr:hypothetical protein [Dongiaceae bacterium]